MTRAAKQTTAVMAGFIPAIHVLFFGDKQDVDARDFRVKTALRALCPGMTAQVSSDPLHQASSHYLPR